MKFAVLVLLCCSALPCLAADSATLLKDETLRSKPFVDGPALTALKRGTVVQVQKRQGAWTQVRNGRQSGWLRSLSLRSSTAAAAAPTSVRLDTGRLGSGRIVSTTGIRGLDAEPETELRNARFNAQALAAADGLAIDADTARAHAAAGRLKQRSVDWLPEPKP